MITHESAQRGFDLMRLESARFAWPWRRIAIGWLLWLVLRAYALARPLRVIGVDAAGNSRLGPQPNPLFLRWFLTTKPTRPDETGTPGWYLHNYRREDHDRREHTHPWTTAHTLILRGGYIETRDGIRRVRLPGDRAVITERESHRIVSVLPNTWTLFYAGPKHGRGWGFR